MSYVTPEGLWHPASHQPLVAVDEAQGYGSPFEQLPYHPQPLPAAIGVNEQMQAEQVSQATDPKNLWEMVKAIPATFLRAYVEQVPIPMAEWEPAGRGLRIFPIMQSPNIVPGRVGYHGRIDRFGPYRQDYSRASQEALFAYLNSALPSEAQGLQNQTAR